MPKDLVKVTALPTKINIGSDSYGPFRATDAKPYTEVPSGLAVGLSLPLYFEPEKAVEKAEPKAPAESKPAAKAEPKKPASSKPAPKAPAAKTAKTAEPEAAAPEAATRETADDNSDS